MLVFKIVADNSPQPWLTRMFSEDKWHVHVQHFEAFWVTTEWFWMESVPGSFCGYHIIIRWVLRDCLQNYCCLSLSGLNRHTSSLALIPASPSTVFNPHDLLGIGLSLPNSAPSCCSSKFLQICHQGCSHLAFTCILSQHFWQEATGGGGGGIKS